MPESVWHLFTFMNRRRATASHSLDKRDIIKAQEKPPQPRQRGPGKGFAPSSATAVLSQFKPHTEI
jgi:hypothetical protein